MFHLISERIKLKILPIFSLRYSSCFLLILLFSSVTILSEYLNATEAYRRITRKSNFTHVSGKVGSYFALIIGINDYVDNKIPDLKTAVADAEAVNKILKDRYGFKSIKIIKNKQATKKAIDKAFREKIDFLGENDSLLIYFAGHGEIDRQVGGGWWIPSDAKLGDVTSYFDNIMVQKYLKAMKARHILLVSDSCYSGTLFGETRNLPSIINDQFYMDLFNERSRWGLTSGNKKPVTDQGFGGHSLFAHQFIRSLKSNKKPFLTPREIYSKIGPVVRNNSEQMPQCRPIIMTGDQGGEFVFILAGSGGVQVESDSDKTYLKVTANVSGARVIVNGKSKGAAPVFFKDLSPGVYKIKVAKEGYSFYQEKVQVSAGRKTMVSAFLEKIQRGPLEYDVWKDPITGMEFVWVNGGCYQMGCGAWAEPCNNDENPVHEVCLDGFWIGKYEVTQGQWKKLMGNNPAKFRLGDNYPVETVSWNDTKKFIEELNRLSEGKYKYSLPSEAQWEYACRSGGKSEAYAGDSDVDNIAWYRSNSGYSTHPIGTKKPNGIGIYDMSGNVWECCEDIYYGNAYSKHKHRNPIYAGNISTKRVMRGGSYNNGVSYLGCAKRDNRYHPGRRVSLVGFRLLRKD